MITKGDAVTLAAKALLAEKLGDEVDITKPEARYVDSTAKDFWSIRFPYVENENKEKSDMFGHTCLVVYVDAVTGTATLAGAS